MAGEKEQLLGAPQESEEALPITEGAEAADPGQAQDGDGGEPSAELAPEIEHDAREMGWVPIEEWRGPKDAWKPADEFVRRGREVLPIVQARARKAEERLRDMERDTEARFRALQADFSERMSRLTRANAETTRLAMLQQRNALWQNFEEQKARAVEEGNAEQYNALRNQQVQTAQQYAAAENEIFDFQAKQANEIEGAAAPQQPEDGLTSTERRAVGEWVNRNPWYMRDKLLTVNAQALSAEIRQEAPGLTPEENLARTEARLKELFPEKFGMSRTRTAQAQPARHAPSLEGGGRQPGGGPRAKGFNDLPPEGKQSFEELVRHGIYTNDAGARARYAKSYWED